jgi:hypothetical protein
MFQKKLEEMKTHILYSVTFFRKKLRLWDSVEKHGRPRQDTEWNKIRRLKDAIFLQDNKDNHTETDAI